VTRRLGAWLGWGALVLDVLLVATGTGLARITPRLPPDLAANGIDVYSVSIVSFAVLGALVMTRHPDNRYGWLVTAIAAVHALGYFNAGLAGWALYREGVPLPAGPYVAWLFVWTAVLHYVPSATFLLLLFPDGHLPSRRWRPLAWLTLVSMLGMAAGVATLPGALAVFSDVRNPFGADGPLPLTLAGSGTVATAIAAVASAVSLFVRYRRAGGVERQQLKWFLYGGAIVATAGVSILLMGLPLVPATVVVSGALVVLAATAGIAIFRYRLYDIDLLINRTLVYGAVSAVLVATYLAVVVLFQAALRPFTAGNELAVAGSTLATLALVQPLRRRIQDGVDRRFYRSRYDAARTLDAFVSRMRDEVDLEQVRGHVLDVVGETVRPAHASVWLRERP